MTTDDDCETTSSAPASGQACSRTASTELSYLRRALWFEAHTARQLSIENPGPVVVAAHALERRTEWAKSTWRQIKAALLFRFEAMGTADSLQAVSLLRDGHQAPCARKTRQTSGRRAKKVTLEALDELVTRIRASDSKYAKHLTTWLLLGAEIGLRPHEWGQSSLVWATVAQAGDSASEPGDVPLPYLKVRNAKDTNGRSHGEFRHLNLSRLEPEMVEAVGRFAHKMSDIAARGGYQSYYDGCRKLLYRVNRELHRDDSSRWIQLYSPRHKFSADAKLALGREEVAALMGHATTKTASQHYGRRISASGTLGPLPVAAEIARIRKIRAYQASSVPAAQPALTTAGTHESSFEG